MKRRHAGLAIAAGLASVLALLPVGAMAQRGGGMRGGGMGGMRGGMGGMPGGMSGMRGGMGGMPGGMGGMRGGMPGGLGGGVGVTRAPGGMRGELPGGAGVMRVPGGMPGGAGMMRSPAMPGGMRPGVGAPGSLHFGNRGPSLGGGPAMGGMRPGAGVGPAGSPWAGGGRPGAITGNPTPGGMRPGVGAPGSLHFGNRGPSLGGGPAMGGMRPGAGGGNPWAGRGPGGPSIAGRPGMTPYSRAGHASGGFGQGGPAGLGTRGLGWRDQYAGMHRNFHPGHGSAWGGMHGPGGRWNNGWGGGWNNGWGGGWNNGWGGGWGGGWNNGWGGGWGIGNGFGWGLGLGLGSRLGWGLGGLGWGNGLGWGWGNGLGWGLGGLGWGNGLGWGWGNGLGWGLSSWNYGPMLYNWGLSGYYNPYYVVPQTVVVEQPPVYDYARPIDPAAVAPEATVSDAADDLFERGREAFRIGMYTAALDFADQALRKMPNDPTLHEFRALSLFALKQYDDAAAALYPVLSLGPGWDWPTLIGLYDNDATIYTGQLRALEAFVRESPKSASAHFLLGYHYLGQGHGEEGLKQFRAASELQPRDALSAKLAKSLEQSRREALGNAADAKPADAAPKPAPEPGIVPPANDARPGKLDGVWTASPEEKTKITLDLSKPDRFGWTVDHEGEAKTYQGARTQGAGILTLVQDGDAAQPPMVGRIFWKDEDHFVFKAAGMDPAEDPGLEFARSK